MFPCYKGKSHDPSGGFQDFQASLRSRGSIFSFCTLVEDLEEGFEWLGRRWNSKASPHKPKTPNSLKRKPSTKFSGQEKRTRLSQNQQNSKRLRTTEPSFSSEDEVDDRKWDDDSDDDEIDPVEKWEPRMKDYTQLPRGGRIANPNNAVLKHRSVTKLTPWLYRLAKPFYNNKIQEISCNFLDYSKRATLVTTQEVSRLLHHAQNEAIKDTSQTSWLCSLPIWTAKNGKKGYPCAEVHGITYYPGNFILLSGKGKSTVKVLLKTLLNLKNSTNI